eukprot:s4853_g3.t1
MKPTTRSQVLRAELADVRQQLRRLQKQSANAKRKKQGRVLRHCQGWRCSPSSTPCLVVLEYSGGSAEVAADFVQGRGCWKKKTFAAGASGFSSGDRQKLVSDIESAYDTAPLSQIGRLRGDPVQAGLVTDAQMLKIVRWLVEHSLNAWVEEQNKVHGVAPSRAQLVEQALCAMPSLAPGFYQQKVRSLLATTSRSQRRWLAKFRLRWGLRVGKLKLCSHLSALAYFQWINAACAAAPAHRPPLLINMDETAVVRHASGLVGTVVKASGQTRAFGEVSCLSDRRSHITFLASICHDREVQLRLPQVLLGNERQFSSALLKSLTALPANVHVWRCKSAWNTHALMRRYLSLLASSLGSVVKDRYVILILDVARCHIHPTILAHAKRCGIRLCYIPALMTAELQPCDTHLFARFKGAFKETWRRQKAASAAGSVTTMQWLEVVVASIEAVLPANDWEAAFAAVGAVAEQTRLGDRLCDCLGWRRCPQVPEVLPSVPSASLALLHQEMENLKRRRVELKRQSKQAAKDQKLLAAKRQRLLKAMLQEVSGVDSAAKGLSADDLQLLLQRAQQGLVPMCWKFRRMLSRTCQVMLLLPSGLLPVAEVVEVVEAPCGARLNVVVLKSKENKFFLLQGADGGAAVGGNAFFQVSMVAMCVLQCR